MGIKEGVNEVEKDTHSPAARDVPVSPKTLLEIDQQQNQSLPEVKALTAERLRKCRSTSVAGIAVAVLSICLFEYRFFVNHIWSWDLLAVGLTFVVVKLAVMAWHYLNY